MRSLVFVVPLFALSACTTVRDVSREELTPRIGVQTFGNALSEPGAIYVWPPYMSAAVVDQQGNRCVLAASGAKTFQADGEGGLKLGELLGKLSNLEASEKQKVIEAFTKTSAADSDAAFADVALFHLCMLDQNGTFKEEEAFKAKPILEAFVKALAIAKSGAAPTP